MIKKIKSTEKDSKKEDLNNKSVDANLTKNETESQICEETDLKDLIEKNIKWSQVIYEQNKKIKNRLTWMVLGSYLRLAIIIIPIILAFIYLPSLLKELFSQYQSVLGGVGGSPSQVNDLLGQVSSNQLQEILKAISNN